MNKFAIFFVALMSSMAVNAADISLVADPWCPYNCEPGDRPGFLVEIAQEIFADAGHTMEYSLMPWKRAKLLIQNGTYDAIVGMTRGPITRDVYVFPEKEMASSQICFYVKKDLDWTFNGVESLESIDLGVINDYGYWWVGSAEDAYFTSGIASGKIDIASGDHPLKQLIRMILADRITATLEDRYVIQYELQKMGKAEALKEAGCQKKIDKIYIAFTKKKETSDDYARILTEGLTKMKNSGEYQRILDSYAK